MSSGLNPVCKSYHWQSRLLQSPVQLISACDADWTHTVCEGKPSGAMEGGNLHIGKCLLLAPLGYAECLWSVGAFHGTYPPHLPLAGKGPPMGLAFRGRMPRIKIIFGNKTPCMKLAFRDEGPPMGVTLLQQRTSHGYSHACNSVPNASSGV